MSKLFLKIGEVGKLDDKGKLIFAKSYKRMVAPKDEPLNWIADVIDQVIIPLMGYSSPEAAKADLANFLEWANGIEVTPPETK